eukprot:g10009.t2
MSNRFDGPHGRHRSRARPDIDWSAVVESVWEPQPPCVHRSTNKDSGAGLFVLLAITIATIEDIMRRLRTKSDSRQTAGSHDVWFDSATHLQSEPFDSRKGKEESLDAKRQLAAKVLAAARKPRRKRSTAAASEAAASPSPSLLLPSPSKGRGTWGEPGSRLLPSGGHDWGGFPESREVQRSTLAAGVSFRLEGGAAVGDDHSHFFCR